MDKKQRIVDIIGQKRLFFDGGTGTVLQKMGLAPGEPPEHFNLTHPELVEELHRKYLLSGADIIKTNTFGVNPLKYENYEEYIAAAIMCAGRAVKSVSRECDAFIAYDIGPTGKMLEPLGDLAFEDAVEIFAAGVRVAESCGADLILIETMNDSYETKAAVLAAKENSTLPIFVTNVYDASEKLMTGASPEAMVAMLEGLGVCAIGANCSLGPDKMLPIAKRLLDAASVPVIINPNAGLPSIVNGESVFSVTPSEFSGYMTEMAEMGVSILGGCCGTTPEHIHKIVADSAKIPYTCPKIKHKTVVSSYTHALTVGDVPILIGERINPTGKPKLKEALRGGNISYVLGEAIKQADAGADALDVNAGLPEIDERATMMHLVAEIQSISDLPLQIDSGDAAVLEGAMRIYNGKPFVNSVNGKAESISSVLPLIKKYGGVVIALTMDESGIPADVRGRVAIAQKILDAASNYGISRDDIIFDPLAMAVSSDKSAARVTLDTVKALHDMGCRTSLGISNVSFGLPARDRITATYFTMALAAGLDVAIMNPHSELVMSAYHTYVALSGLDEGFSNYISFAEREAEKSAKTADTCAKIDEKGSKNSTPVSKKSADSVSELHRAIVKGLKDDAGRIAVAESAVREPTEIINSEIIPALTEIGADFEAGRAYLPSLLMSAEAAVAAFSVIKEKIKKCDPCVAKTRIILATVKGDIHDIGKNIVKVLLESHGYEVMDLGRDVAPERVLAAARESGIRLVGLSALMTTTVGAMADTIKLLRSEIPDVRIMVGGAVMTREYADMIGADFYARDAMEAVRLVGGIENP